MMYSLSLRVLEKEKSLATCHSKTPTQFDRSILVHGFADSIHCVQLNVKCSKCGVRNKPTHTHIHQMEQLRWGIGEKIQYYWIWTLAAFFIKRDSFKSDTPIVSIHTENIYTHTQIQSTSKREWRQQHKVEKNWWKYGFIQSIVFQKTPAWIVAMSSIRLNNTKTSFCFDRRYHK